MYRNTTSHYLVLILALTLGCMQIVVADEASTSRRFEQAKASEPQLIAFLKGMPKGADLHIHLSGALYGEDYLDAAISNHLYFDPKANTFTNTQKDGTIPSADLVNNPTLYGQYLNAVSLRGYFAPAADSHDHFFNTFPLFSTPYEVITQSKAVEIVLRRAINQKISYLEIDSNPAPWKDWQIAAATDSLQDIGDASDTALLQKSYDTVSARFPALIAATKSQLDGYDTEIARSVGSAPPISGTAGPVNIRFIIGLPRQVGNTSFFAQMACAMALAHADPRVAGITILQAEDDVRARQHFAAQMRIIDFLWTRLGKPNMALHAGELTLRNSTLDAMSTRIRESLEKGHSKRIGHGVSIAWEDNAEQLLREMKAQDVAVEICLSSNDGILDVSGDHHPFALYRKAGVPVTLNTDDEGVNRSNLTNEFVKAVRTYGLSYKDVKNLARNSIEYAFLPGESLYVNHDYNHITSRFAKIINDPQQSHEEDRAALNASPKLTLEMNLERAFAAFEK